MYAQWKKYALNETVGDARTSRAVHAALVRAAGEKGPYPIAVLPDGRETEIRQVRGRALQIQVIPRDGAQWIDVVRVYVEEVRRES